MVISRKNITILCCIVLLDQASFGVLLPIFTVLLTDQKYGLSVDSYFLYGAFFSTFSFFQFFSATILGELSDHVGRKKVIFVCLCFMWLSFFLYGLGIFLASFYILLFGRIMAGMSAGSLGVVFASVSDSTKGDARIKRISIITAFSGLGIILGPTVGALFFESKSLIFSSLYMPIVLFLFLSGVLLFIFKKNWQETLQVKVPYRVNIWSSWENIKKSLLGTQMRCLYGISFLVTSFITTFVVFGSLFLTKTLSLPINNIAHLLVIFGIGIVLAQVFVYKMSKSIFLKNFSVPFFSACLVPGLLIYKIAIFPYLYISLVSIAFCIGVLFTFTLNLINKYSSDQNKGEAIGLNTSIQTLAQTLSLLFAGILSRLGGLESVFTYLIGMALSISLVGVFFWKNNKI